MFRKTPAIPVTEAILPRYPGTRLPVAPGEAWRDYQENCAVSVSVLPSFGIYRSSLFRSSRTRLPHRLNISLIKGNIFCSPSNISRSLKLPFRTCYILVCLLCAADALVEHTFLRSMSRRYLHLPLLVSNCYIETFPLRLCSCCMVPGSFRGPGSMRDSGE